jgi:hypothetical protein
MRLNRFAAALDDWDRASELDSGSDRGNFQLQRALCLARVEPAKAVAAIEDLIKGEKTAAAVLYDAACVCSVSAAQVKDDARRDTFAARAVALLHQARIGGFFQDPGRVEHMKKDADLDALRSRDDFKKLLADVERMK